MCPCALAKEALKAFELSTKSGLVKNKLESEFLKGKMTLKELCLNLGLSESQISGLYSKKILKESYLG